MLRDLVILAAGRGTRLGEHSQDMPKSLVRIAGRSYLAYQLEGFSRFAFNKKLIVGGFGISYLRDFLCDAGIVDYELVENIDFHKGNLYSLAAARPQLIEDFFVFNADHFYSDAIYKKIFSSHCERITVFCDQDRTLTDDDMKVQSETVAGEAHLKAMAKSLTQFDCGYVGVTCVPLKCATMYWRAFEAVATELGDKANVEHVLDVLARCGEKIRIADVSGSWWTEIDTPADLENASRIIRDKLGVGGT